VPDSALATFAAELKAWRERMELTQNAFADKIGYSLALVSAVEQCKRSPRPDFAARCDEVTGAPGTFARWQAQVARESYPAFFAPVLQFERDAVRIHGWELGAVPGLVQTEAYAEAVVRARNPSGSAEEIERIVSARMDPAGSCCKCCRTRREITLEWKARSRYTSSPRHRASLTRNAMAAAVSWNSARRSQIW